MLCETLLFSFLAALRTLWPTDLLKAFCVKAAVLYGIYVLLFLSTFEEGTSPVWNEDYENLIWFGAPLLF